MPVPAPEPVPAPPTAALSGLTFHLVGPGRVGESLGRWLVASGARALTVRGRDEGRADRLAREWGARAGTARDSLRPGTGPADLLLLAVPDTVLPEVAARLAGRIEASVALHTAGALGASSLAPLRDAGTATGSCHPLMAFPAVISDPAVARGIVFAIDGDLAAKALATRLARAWGGLAVEVHEASRRLYHAAATLAAGGVTTLVGAAWRLAQGEGLPPEVGHGYMALAIGALERAASAEHPSDAITGPVARGDLPAVLAAIAAIERVDPALAELSRRLALETLHQLRERGRESSAGEALDHELSRPRG